MTDMTLMERVERLEREMAEIQRLRREVWKPILPGATVPDPRLYTPSGSPLVYPSDSVVPRPAEELKRPEFDLLAWAAANPDKARQITAEAIHNMLGGDAPATPERDANLQRATDAEFERYYGGFIPFRDTKPADWAFLQRAQPYWRPRWGTDIWQAGIVAGMWRDLAAAASAGEGMRNNYTDSDANPLVVEWVKARLG